MTKVSKSNSSNEPSLHDIDRILQEAASRGWTPEEKFEQRVSWAYGQYPDGSMSKDDVREHDGDSHDH